MNTALLAGSAVALVLGIGWASSPLTVVTGAALAWICRRSIACLDGRERRHVVRILILGVGLRVLAIGGMLLATRPDHEPFFALFPDSRYILDRALWIRNAWLGVTIGPHQSLGIVDPYAASSYPYLLAVLQTLAGPSPYALCLLSVAFFTGGALLIHRMTREVFGGPAATLALALAMFWPTLFAWSISVLRESFQFLLGALVAGALYYILRAARMRTKAGWALTLAGALWSLSTLREGTVEIALLAIVLTLVFRAVAARPSIAVALIAVAALGLVRFEARIMPQVRLAADRHVGHVMSAGKSYRLLDEAWYARGTAALPEMTFDDGMRYLAASAVAFVVVPLPWEAESVSEAVLVPQQITWYAALAAAVFGVAIGVRRDAWLASILLAYPVAGLIVIGPNSGNIGTLVRHRDMIVPFVLSLGAAGLAAAIARLGTTAPVSVAQPAGAEA